MPSAKITFHKVYFQWRPGVTHLRKKYEKEHDTILPHTGVLHDMGACISHKSGMVRKVIPEKKDPAHAAKETSHIQKAVDRYLTDYHRIKAVYDNNQDIQHIHIVTGIARHVVKEYAEIIIYAKIDLTCHMAISSGLDFFTPEIRVRYF